MNDNVLDLIKDYTVSELSEFALELKAFITQKKADALVAATVSGKETLQVGQTVTVLSKGTERTGVVTKVGDKTMFSVAFPDGAVTSKGNIRSTAIRYDKLISIDADAPDAGDGDGDSAEV